MSANGYEVSFGGDESASKLPGDGLVSSQNYGYGKMERALDLTSEDLVES